MVKKSLLFSFLCLSALPLLAQNKPKKTAVDPDDAYKNNCMRCHASVRDYSPSKTATIVMHMRVRANLSAEETQAILQFLQDNAGPKPAAKWIPIIDTRPRAKE
jgi:hypothetical protein